MWDKWSARHMAGDVVYCYQILFLEQRHCHCNAWVWMKNLGLTNYCNDWVVQPFCLALSLGFFCLDTSQRHSSGSKRRAKRNCSTQSANDSKSTRIFSSARLSLVCLCFGVSCELDLCPVSLASAVVALLATTAVAVFQYCLAMFLYGCHFALVARGSLLTFAHRWLIFAHVHSFGHLVDSGVFVAYSLPQCPENRRVWVNK